MRGRALEAGEGARRAGGRHAEPGSGRAFVRRLPIAGSRRSICRKSEQSGQLYRMAKDGFETIDCPMPHASEQRQLRVAVSGVRLPGLRNPWTLDRDRRRSVRKVPCRDLPGGRVSGRSGGTNRERGTGATKTSVPLELFPLWWVSSRLLFAAFF
jgi:hypothetical protein